MLAQGKKAQGQHANATSPLLNRSIANSNANSPKGIPFESNGANSRKSGANSVALQTQLNHTSSQADRSNTKTAAAAAAAAMHSNSVASPQSSCSNSPSSIRINQNYNPNSQENQLIVHSPNQTTKTATALKENANDSILGNSNNGTVVSSSENQCIDIGRSDREVDLDNSNDADSKPLLAASTINGNVSTNRRINGKYGINSSHNLEDGGDETETLISNSGEA